MGDKELPGEDTDGETPVPIPNTEAKLVRPMVVLRGESRYRQDFMKAECLKAFGLHRFAYCVMRSSSQLDARYLILVAGCWLLVASCRMDPRQRDPK
jgi:hypothetical protein